MATDPPESLFYAYAFALRDPLPIPDDGWGARACVQECPRRPHELSECHGYFVRFFQATAENLEYQQVMAALADLSFGPANKTGAEPGGQRAGPLGPKKQHTFAVIASHPDRLASDDGEDRVFHFVYKVAQGLRIQGQSPYLPLTAERIWPFCFQGYLDSSGHIINPSIRLMPSFIALPTPTVVTNPQTIEEYVALASAEDPVVAFNDLSLGATNAARHDGDYVGAVLKSAAAAEVLLKHLAAMLIWEVTVRHGGGQKTDWASQSTLFPLNRKPSDLIGSVLSQALSGGWDSNSRTRPIGAWRFDIAQVRNRVIHRGHRPSAEEAHTAVEALDALRQFVGQRLAARAKQFPRTFYLVNGRPACPASVLKVLDDPAEGGIRNAYLQWIATNDTAPPD